MPHLTDLLGGKGARVEDRQAVVEPTTRAEWRAWLRDHSREATGVWLVLRKGKDADLSYEDAVEEAVAFGWIDSKANKLDDRRYKLRFTPRKPHSGWSASNKERVARLIATGLMTETGMAAVEIAKANGSWDSLDQLTRLEIPPDLAEALAANSEASRFFEAFPPSSKQIILGWIASTKRPETRRKRVEETVRLAAQNKRAKAGRLP